MPPGEGDPKIQLPYVIDFLFPNAPTLKTNTPSLSVNLRIPREQRHFDSAMQSANNLENRRVLHN